MTAAAYGSLLSQGRRQYFLPSIRRQRDLVVDQRIERGLDVDLCVDDAGLLQREAGGENGVALRGADAAVGEFGAFLELLVDHLAGQLGDADEGLLQAFVIRQRS